AGPERQAQSDDGEADGKTCVLHKLPPGPGAYEDQRSETVRENVLSRSAGNQAKNTHYAMISPDVDAERIRCSRARLCWARASASARSRVICRSGPSSSSLLCR